MAARTLDDRTIAALCAELQAALEPDRAPRLRIPEPDATAAARVKAARARMTLIAAHGRA